MNAQALFHLAFPVNDLEEACRFYGGLLGCPEDRSSPNWIDFDFYGHQIVAHLSPDECGHRGTSEDSSYTGQTEVIRKAAPNTQDFIHEKGYRQRPLTDSQQAKNCNKSKVRAKDEHPFLIIKRVLGFAKVRYRGPVKNAHRWFATCALANLFRVRRHLLQESRA
jgi:catechol 2,3-dioxygenase-like lactoylglutathione lyase family enzyme